MKWFVIVLLHLAPPLPAHLFYDNACCHEQHCHPVPCDEVVDVRDGWRWHDRYFTKEMMKVSQDGGCHICVTSVAPLCIYLPPRV